MPSMSASPKRFDRNHTQRTEVCSPGKAALEGMLPENIHSGHLLSMSMFWRSAYDLQANLALRCY